MGAAMSTWISHSVVKLTKNIANLQYWQNYNHYANYTLLTKARVHFSYDTLHVSALKCSDWYLSQWHGLYICWDRSLCVY